MMPNQASEHLILNSERILNLWTERVRNEIAAARDQNVFIIRDTIPLFISDVAKALSVTIDRTIARIKLDKEEMTRTGRAHGSGRAQLESYSIDQLIWEYHILRQAIFDVMEETSPLNSTETEIIVGAIEQSMKEAATEFSDTIIRIQEKLTAALAHDLRSPITVAQTSAELLLKRADDKIFVMQSGMRIINSMSRLSSMIHDILDVSTMKSGKCVPLELKECDLELIARQVVDEFNELSGCPLVLKSNGQALGYWSEDGLRRVLENLASNAVKYGTHNSNVAVEIKQTATQVELTVHNEGNPIPKEEQSTLFQQFHRLRPMEKDGWGLGLSVVKGIVESHHGGVWVESEEGKGTTFTISLPKNLVRQVA